MGTAVASTETQDGESWHTLLGQEDGTVPRHSRELGRETGVTVGHHKKRFDRQSTQ